eukprot:197797_1
MDWDRGSVTYSSQIVGQHIDNGAIDNKVVQSKFRQFLREFREDGVDETFLYRERLLNNYETRRYLVTIDFDDLNTFDPELSEKFRENPSIYLPLFENAAQEVVAMTKFPKPSKDEMHKIQVQIINVLRQPIPIRRLHAEHISKLVRVPGIVTSASKPRCKATRFTLRCTNCKATITRRAARGFGSIQIPRTCENASDEKNDKPCPVDPFEIVADKCSFLDIQKLKLQEAPEDIPTGEMPRHIWLFCERNLVNKVKPGARVVIVGIYKIFDAKLSNKRTDSYASSVRKPYIEVIGMEESNVSQKHGKFTAEEEEAIRDLSRLPNIHNIIQSSISPAIWGNEDIKLAIACLLFGGSRKSLPGNMKLRGDINVLLLGDPSVAKSQFLKFVDEVAPIAVYTSGKGSSAAGLTASVIKEPGTGEFHLAAGAMVLADGGVVCIDEFDKMRESDRVAIHEAMEQQTISIAKAGITTILNSRASVLAAANPIFGRYDELRTTSENIDFETTILSRFDLIFIIRDIKDVQRDTRLAHHIMGLHINVNGASNKNKDDSNSGSEISPDLMSKYIAYARHRIHPRLTRKAADVLKNHYVSFRRETKLLAEESGELSAIPLTVRQLESLIRISESLAKMQLSEEANEEHVKEAVRLFKVSTLKAAKEGTGAAGVQLDNNQYLESVQKAERNIKRRLPIGSKTSVSKLVGEMARRQLTEGVVNRALNIMHSRGEIEYRARRRQIYRLK